MSSSFTYHTQKKKKTGKKILIFVVLLVVFLLWGWISRGPRDLQFQPGTKIAIVKGDTIAKFYKELTKPEIFWFKRYLKRHKEVSTTIQEGTYVVSGGYTAADFLARLAKGPQEDSLSTTILEGWSMYDIDDSLTKKGYIQPGEYIEYVTNPEKIAALAERYDFFTSSIKSLEGFLYPDTYVVSAQASFVKELVSIQLNTFKKKVREPYVQDFPSIKNTYGIEVYQAVTLASIIEKEEKADGNKPTVAGIFYNRLQRGMLLGADITLCYYFQQPYASCTPSVIAKNVSDAKNPYNTRQVAGFPPTPIGNPNVVAIQAVLFPKKTAYLFYLHDADGGIHYAETNEGHNRNKAQYL